LAVLATYGASVNIAGKTRAEDVKANSIEWVPDGGAQEKVTQLYHDTKATLSLYFLRRHGSPEVADDLLQETFLRLMRRIGRCLAAESPRAYLFGIARHVSLDAWRTKGATPPMVAETPPDQAAANADPRVAAAREIITSMTPQHREILNLRLEHDLSYAEIAEALGVPVGTVRSRLHHALLELRERLRAEEEK
jgi:RNA polymerase sigma-70 factor (ECF subfamily)